MLAHWLSLSVDAGKDRFGRKIAAAGLYAPCPGIHSGERGERMAATVTMGWTGLL